MKSWSVGETVCLMADSGDIREWSVTGVDLGARGQGDVIELEHAERNTHGKIYVPKEMLVYAVRCSILMEAIERGGWDISPCGDCGRPVVCIPDGLPMCEACAKESEV